MKSDGDRRAAPVTLKRIGFFCPIKLNSTNTRNLRKRFSQIVTTSKRQRLLLLVVTNPRTVPGHERCDVWKYACGGEDLRAGLQRARFSAYALPRVLPRGESVDASGRSAEGVSSASSVDARSPAMA